MKKKKEALLQADISSLVRSHVLLQWADRTPPCPAPPTLRQASRGQPSMEEIFLFRWGLREGAQNGITEEEYNVVWHALRETPIRPTFAGGNQIWQSCVKILICLERISAPYFWEEWKSVVTAACQRRIFRTSDLNGESSLRGGE